MKARLGRSLDTIHELVNYGLDGLEANGQAKRPVRWYDEIEIPLTRLADASDDTVVARFDLAIYHVNRPPSLYRWST